MHITFFSHLWYSSRAHHVYSTPSRDFECASAQRTCQEHTSRILTFGTTAAHHVKSTQAHAGIQSPHAKRTSTTDEAQFSTELEARALIYQIRLLTRTVLLVVSLIYSTTAQRSRSKQVTGLIHTPNPPPHTRNSRHLLCLLLCLFLLCVLRGTYYRVASMTR